MTQQKYIKYLPLFVIFTLIFIDVSTTFNSVLSPLIKEDFAITAQLAHTTMSLSMLALGISCLFYGGLSDNFGRRPVILVGFGIFCLSSLVVAWAPTIEIFIAARIGQGLGAGVGWIIGNASLKDVFKGKDYPRIINVVHASVGLSPALIPLLASYSGGIFGWRASFAATGIIACLFYALLIWRFPETNTDSKTLTIKTYLKIYGTLLRNKKYMGLLAVKALNVLLMFSEGATLPLLFVQHHGIAPTSYGWYAMPCCLLYALSSFISSKLVRKYDASLLIKIGIALIFISNAVVLGMNTIQPLTALYIQIIKSFSYIGWGMIFGNATASVIEAAKKYPSTAASLLVACEMGASAAGIWLEGLFFNGTIVPLSVMMCIASGLSMLILVLKFWETED